MSYLLGRQADLPTLSKTMNGLSQCLATVGMLIGKGVRMNKHCPECGGFVAAFNDLYTLGTRPDGTKLMGRGTRHTCTKCGWYGPLECSTLDYARQEAEAGRLTIDGGLECTTL